MSSVSSAAGLGRSRRGRPSGTTSGSTTTCFALDESVSTICSPASDSSSFGSILGIAGAGAGSRTAAAGAGDAAGAGAGAAGSNTLAGGANSAGGGAASCTRAGASAGAGGDAAMASCPCSSACSALR